MTSELFIGDRTYSSWSLRGWLLFARFDIPVTTHDIRFADGAVADQMAGARPARTVPTWRTPEGAIVSDSLAIAEELATRHPNAGLWPSDPAARAVARSITAEMHSGFSTLRTACPMNLRDAYRGAEPSDGVTADLARIEELWTLARAYARDDGPWLFGAYSVADAFYAPVAARIAGYGLKVGAEASVYVSRHLSDIAFRQWRAVGLVRDGVLSKYAQEHDAIRWPGPELIAAKAVDAGEPENTECPYSGKPVQHLLQIGDRCFGFCNAGCRDKTVADPEAWPSFMAIYRP